MKTATAVSTRVSDGLRRWGSTPRDGGGDSKDLHFMVVAVEDLPDTVFIPVRIRREAEPVEAEVVAPTPRAVSAPGGFTAWTRDESGRYVGYKDDVELIVLKAPKGGGWLFAVDGDVKGKRHRAREAKAAAQAFARRMKRG